MLCNAQNTTQHLGSWICFRLQVRGRRHCAGPLQELTSANGEGVTYLLYPLQKSNLDHWTYSD
jgi:hypothetical protein